MSGQLVRIEQALFGYRQGHELLASSTEFARLENAFLQSKTDLASIDGFEYRDNYVSGFPLGDGTRYVLVCTWPAPEQTRPGCVWSHVLLLQYADFGSIRDAAGILQLFKRPNSIMGFDDYSRTISVDLSKASGWYDKKIDKPTVVSVIDSVYKTDKSVIVRSQSLDMLSLVLLGIWCQQWPRLRRAFSFSTAYFGTPSKGASRDSFRFDVQVVPSGVRTLRVTEATAVLNLDQLESFPKVDWASVAADELLGSKARIDGNIGLADFLQQYGADTSSSRSDFALLASFYAESPGILGNGPVDVASYISALMKFPSEGQAQRLKKDVLERALLRTNELWSARPTRRFSGSLSQEQIDALYTSFATVFDRKQECAVEYLRTLTQQDMSEFTPLWNQFGSHFDGKWIDLLREFPYETFIQVIDLASSHSISEATWRSILELPDNDARRNYAISKIVGTSFKTAMAAALSLPNKQAVIDLLRVSPQEALSIFVKEVSIKSLCDKSMHSVLTEIAKDLRLLLDVSADEGDKGLKFLNEAMRFVNYDSLPTSNIETGKWLQLGHKVEDNMEPYPWVTRAIFRVGLGVTSPSSIELLSICFDTLLGEATKVESHKSRAPFTKSFVQGAWASRSLFDRTSLINAVENKIYREKWSKKMVTALTDDRRLKKHFVTLAKQITS